MELTSPWTSDQFWRESSREDNGEYHSLALPGLVDRLTGERKCRILDLGPAHGTTVAFFSQYSCKLYIADLYRSLKTYRVDGASVEQSAEPPDEEKLAAERARMFEKLLPYDSDTRFDLILAWDLLNYLAADQIGSLGRRLARFCHDKTKLFAMVAIHQEIPARPCEFKIRDMETLEYDSVTSRKRSAPRHAEPTLRRLLWGFDVESTYVLRNGLQEYVFTYTGGLAHRRAS